MKSHNDLRVVSVIDLVDEVQLEIPIQERLHVEELTVMIMNFNVDLIGEYEEMCEECNLVLNLEKCHFMVKEGIVLDHKISNKGIEVDRELIEKLSPSISTKGIRSFLGHSNFYRRFIKDVSKIAHLLSKLLEKEMKFVFVKACLKAFKELKEKLVSIPIIISPDWKQPFVVMCDVSGVALSVMLGQRHEKILHPIYYASKALNVDQRNYIVTE
ncbi:uncharacterized mitochondrial protein AtMg00860-like [Solanum dulcamara]|uniref:uncharacterized mitochondrial protein AtMg00860-like n=1 Tax=Solanum dulcamara TaxID=45834 RepID=UPI0024862BA8|nr:uncharacterized mitochondrial protein AtMg00860-like [Solanum dulcamara]